MQWREELQLKRNNNSINVKSNFSDRNRGTKHKAVSPGYIDFHFRYFPYIMWFFHAWNETKADPVFYLGHLTNTYFPKVFS